MGHAFITRSSFHQPLAPLLSLPTAEPSVPEVSVTGDNMSPSRSQSGGKQDERVINVDMRQLGKKYPPPGPRHFQVGEEVMVRRLGGGSFRDKRRKRVVMSKGREDRPPPSSSTHTTESPI
ncbi:hypothetical protein NQZ68_025533 [Dissostichus eleginoides]|nr:hypothetical protein NQZ68_025533 [Dissostichus eleginoides]